MQFSEKLHGSDLEWMSHRWVIASETQMKHDRIKPRCKVSFGVELNEIGIITMSRVSGSMKCREL